MGIGQLPEKVQDWATECDAAKRDRKTAMLIAIACRVIRFIGSPPVLDGYEKYYPFQWSP
jgi:hypothetical protein